MPVAYFRHDPYSSAGKKWVSPGKAFAASLLPCCCPAPRDPRGEQRHGTAPPRSTAPRLENHWPICTPVLPLLPVRNFAYGEASARLCHRSSDGEICLFIGQLPYHLSEANIRWLMWTLVKRDVLHVEKIVKWRYGKQPLGCYHVYCAKEDVYAFLAVDQVALCDREVVWIPENEAQWKALLLHCSLMRHNCNLPLNLPRQMMTVQIAMSTYPHLGQFSDRNKRVGW